MLIARIDDATRNFGAPPDWDGKDLHCGVLPVKDVTTPEGPFMISAWEPTPFELARIAAGAKIELWVRGSVHPVVMVGVGEVP